MIPNFGIIPNLENNLAFKRVKASGIEERKHLCIANTKVLAFFDPRELSRSLTADYFRGLVLNATQGISEEFSKFWLSLGPRKSCLNRFFCLGGIIAQIDER